MKRVVQILKIVQLFIYLPIEISFGSKKKSYIKLKKMMMEANLL